MSHRCTVLAFALTLSLAACGGELIQGEPTVGDKVDLLSSAALGGMTLSQACNKVALVCAATKEPIACDAHKQFCGSSGGSLQLPTKADICAAVDKACKAGINKACDLHTKHCGTAGSGSGGSGSGGSTPGAGGSGSGGSTPGAGGSGGSGSGGSGSGGSGSGGSGSGGSGSGSGSGSGWPSGVPQLPPGFQPNAKCCAAIKSCIGGGDCVAAFQICLPGVPLPSWLPSKLPNLPFDVNSLYKQVCGN